MKLVKGSAAAKAHMARLRAMAGKRRKAVRPVTGAPKRKNPYSVTGEWFEPGFVIWDTPVQAEAYNAVRVLADNDIPAHVEAAPGDPKKFGSWVYKVHIDRPEDSTTRMIAEGALNRIASESIKGRMMGEWSSIPRPRAPRRGRRRVALPNPRRPKIDPIDRAIEQAYYRVASGVQVSIMDIPKIFRDAKTLLAGGRTDIDQVLIEVVKRYQVAGTGGRILNNPHGARGAYFIIDPVTNRILWIVRGHPMHSFNNSVKLATEAAAKLGRNVVHVVHPYVPAGFKKGTEVTPIFYHYGSNTVTPEGKMFKTIYDNPPAFFLIDAQNGKILEIFKGHPAKTFKKSVDIGMLEAARTGRPVIHVVHPRVPAGFRVGHAVSPMFYHYGANIIYPDGRMVKRNPKFKARFTASDGVEMRTETLWARSALKKADRMTLDMPAQFRGPRSEIEVTRCNPRGCKNPGHRHARKNPSGWSPIGLFTSTEATSVADRLRAAGIQVRAYETVPNHVTLTVPSSMRRAARALIARKNPLMQVVTLKNPKRPQASRSVPFDVYLDGKKIDTVFAGPKSDAVAEEVRLSLINHDGYDPRIVVRRRGGKAGSRPVRKNPVGKIPFRHGQIITVAQALAWAKQTGNTSLVKQCEQAIALCKKANGPAQKVRFDLVQMGDPKKIESVMAGVEYGQTDETVYKPTKGSKKGQHLYRHEWGEGSGKRKPVPLIAPVGGKALVMPLGSRQTAGDWLRG